MLFPALLSPQDGIAPATLRPHVMTASTVLGSLAPQPRSFQSLPRQWAPPSCMGSCRQWWALSRANGAARQHPDSVLKSYGSLQPHPTVAATSRAGSSCCSCSRNPAAKRASENSAAFLHGQARRVHSGHTLRVAGRATLAAASSWSPQTDRRHWLPWCRIHLVPCVEDRVAYPTLPYP